MFDELKEVKYFKEITKPYNVKYFKEERSKTFEESLLKSRDVFRTQGSIYDGAFL